MARRQMSTPNTLRWRWIATLLAVASIVSCANALSTRPQPLKRVHVPRKISTKLIRKRNIHRLNALAGETSFGQAFKRYAAKRSLPSAHQLLDARHVKAHWEDSVLLQFEIEDGQERISILMHPTDNLLHPDARIVSQSIDAFTGQLKETAIPISRENVLAYTGYVLREHEVDRHVEATRIGVKLGSEEHDASRLASIMLSHPHDDWKQGTLAEGVFQIDGEFHHLKTVENWHRTRTDKDAELEPRHLIENEGLVLFRDRDLAESSLAKRSEASTSCGHDDLSFNTDLTHPIYDNARHLAFDAQYGRQPGVLDNLLGLDIPLASSLAKRQRTGGGDIGGGDIASNYINSIGSTSGCPKSQRVLYMGFAADCGYVQTYNGQSGATQQILTNMNIVNPIYQRTFNVSLGIVEVNVVSETCPTSVNSTVPWNVPCEASNGLTLNERLSAFSQWRGRKGGADGAGLWHLMTACSSPPEVGVAWLGTLCRVTSSQSSTTGETTSGTGVTSITSREWQVVAHEIGHNFGAVHDCSQGCSLSGSCCPLSTSTCNADGNFIMSPTSQRNTSTFSQCTLGNVCSALGTSLNTTCLYEPGQRTLISTRQCGNGILEPGEACDPGPNGSACCTSNCQLRSGAVCDPGTSPCCTDSCNFASNSTVCRPAVNSQCDIAETCTGQSGDCPEDKTQPDGAACGQSGQGLSCAAGYCTSRDAQCASVGASYGITRACGASTSSDCQITCASPSGGSSCIILEGQYFADGTSCGFGGRCYSGNCRAGNVSEQISGWYRNNLRISIPVTIVGGIIVLLILYGILRCCFRGCRRNKNVQPASAQYYQPPPPNQMSQPQYPYPSYQPNQSNYR